MSNVKGTIQRSIEDSGRFVSINTEDMGMLSVNESGKIKIVPIVTKELKESIRNKAARRLAKKILNRISEIEEEKDNLKRMFLGIIPFGVEKELTRKIDILEEVLVMIEEVKGESIEESM